MGDFNVSLTPKDRHASISGDIYVPEEMEVMEVLYCTVLYGRHLPAGSRAHAWLLHSHSSAVPALHAVSRLMSHGPMCC